MVCFCKVVFCQIYVNGVQISIYLVNENVWNQIYSFGVLMFYNRAGKPLSIFPACINVSQLLYITSSPERHPYKWCVIISGVSFLKVLFYCIIRSEFLILTCSIPKMMVSEKYYTVTVMFLECKVVVTYPYW